MRDGLRYDGYHHRDDVLDLLSPVLGLLQYPLNIATAFRTTKRKSSRVTVKQRNNLSKVVLCWIFPTTVNELELSKVCHVQVGRNATSNSLYNMGRQILPAVDVRELEVLN